MVLSKPRLILGAAVASSLQLMLTEKTGGTNNPRLLETQILRLWPWSAVMLTSWLTHPWGGECQLFNWKGLGNDPLFRELKRWWRWPWQEPMVRSPWLAGASGSDRCWEGVKGEKKGKVCLGGGGRKGENPCDPVAS